MRQLAVIALAVLVTASAAEGAWPRPDWRMPAPDGPEVLFTFDDGPDARYTPRVLEILRQRGIQAIFFWVGHRIDWNKERAAERRAAATKALSEGHLIGTHTVNHAHLCSMPPEQGAEEIDLAIAQYEKLTRLPMLLFRTPYGDHCDRVKALLEERGLEHVHWDMDPREWIDHDSSRVAGYFIARLRRLEGRAIVLMHDTKLVTPRALTQVLNWIDSENARRKKKGEKTIRIVDASEWIETRIDPALRRFSVGLATDSLKRLQEVGRRLVPTRPPTILSSSQP